MVSLNGQWDKKPGGGTHMWAYIFSWDILNKYKGYSGRIKKHS